MAGWLIQVTVPGTDHNTRFKTERYAASFSNLAAAKFAVLDASGAENPKVVRALSSRELADAGITAGLEVRIVSPDF